MGIRGKESEREGNGDILFLDGFKLWDYSYLGNCIDTVHFYNLFS